MRLQLTNLARATTAALLASLLSTAAFAQTHGFSVAVDGEHLAGDPLKLSTPRKTDVGLAATDIQIRYAGMEVRPTLNVLPRDLRRTYLAGETVELYLTTNYPAFISRAEIIISDGDGVVATLPVVPNGTARWTMSSDGSDAFTYVARVHDGLGRFDETAPLELVRTGKTESAAPSDDAIAPGWGEDRAALRTIPIAGGAVVVHGTSIAAGAQVVVLGETVPVDRSGAFVIDRILPAGQHDVAISVADPAAETIRFRRTVAVPDSDWFYVALADLTLGSRTPSARLEPVASGEFSETYVKGQAQFYLKGKIKGEYLLTASGDTGEGPLEDMFQGVLSKDPRAVLSRIDPNDYYPVYGDDSEIVQDAPTRGKFYVRLERGNSNVMWGTFRTEIANSAFHTDNRVLYGASATYTSEDITSAGEHRVKANLHAAHPGTLSQRDVLRGAGGSAYFLHRQDVMPDSETITVEIRDGVSGVVRSRRTLVKGTDYRINYMQGVLILTTPLASSLASSALASAVADTQYLVVQYEYSPPASTMDGYALAGAGQAWLNDHLSIGGTVVREEIDGETTTLLGLDARLEASEATFVEAEVMRSEGAGRTSWVSLDGGLTFVEESVAKRLDGAYAARVRAEADLASLGLNGTLGASVELREAGFAGVGAATSADQVLIGTFATLALTEHTSIAARFDSAESPGSSHIRSMNAELSHELTDALTVTAGVSHLDIASGQRIGRRTDLAVGVAYVLTEDLDVSAYVRKTMASHGTLERADRVGLGANYRINDVLTLEGEVSTGATGFGGMVGLVHQPTPDERNYFGYRLNAQDNVGLAASARTGLVVGSERKVNEVVALHSEAIYNTFDRNRTLTQSYGVTLTPDQIWTFSGGFDSGNIYDPDGEDFYRTAVSFGAAYDDDGVTGSVRGELRNESSSSGARNGQSILLASSLSWRTSDDWRLIGSVDGLLSTYDNRAILDGDYVEANIGYAYRPVDNERLNALMRYTFLYDLPGVQQVSQNGSANGPAQRSHILSADANYDITEWLTLGAKYAVRVGEISESRDAADFVRSSAHLGIVRLDAEFAKGWDVLLEGRAMALPDAKTLDIGALAAVYYSVDNNVRVGVGYNFAGFSDDLRDLKQDHQGVFFNMMAKY